MSPEWRSQAVRPKLWNWLSPTTSTGYRTSTKAPGTPCWFRPTRLSCGPISSRNNDIEASKRFYVRLTNHTSEVAQITLSVAFDGEVGYSQRANLSEGGALEFSEVFFGT